RPAAPAFRHPQPQADLGLATVVAAALARTARRAEDGVSGAPPTPVPTPTDLWDQALRLHVGALPPDDFLAPRHPAAPPATARGEADLVGLEEVLARTAASGQARPV